MRSESGNEAERPYKKFMLTSLDLEVSLGYSWRREYGGSVPSRLHNVKHDKIIQLYDRKKLK